LSDQYLGTPDSYAEVRRTIVQHIRDNKADFYGSFAQGEGSRDRSNLTRHAAPKPQTAPRQGETLEQTLDRLMNEMAKNREWGGEREITAFARAYHCNVVVFCPQERVTNGHHYLYEPMTTSERYVHIAYGGSELQHYWSVRKDGGPHTGPTNIGSTNMQSTDTGPDITRQVENDETPIATVKQIDTIKDALVASGFKAETDAIKKVLEKCRGDLNNAFSSLIDDELPGSSRSPSQDSSRSKRSAIDSDTEDLRGSKRRNTRLGVRKRARLAGVVHGEADSVEVAFHVRVDSPPGGEVTDHEKAEGKFKAGTTAGEVTEAGQDNAGVSTTEKAKNDRGKTVKAKATPKARLSSGSKAA